MAPRDVLVAWLNDAYALETALVPVLESHAGDARESPLIQTQLQEHADQTRHHAEQVCECLKLLGESPSTIKSGLGSLFGHGQAWATALFSDELVKNAITDYAAENLEIACYAALIVAAEEYGSTEIAVICREILRDEQEMAAWLLSQLPRTVADYLHQTIATP